MKISNFPRLLRSTGLALALVTWLDTSHVQANVLDDFWGSIEDWFEQIPGLACEQDQFKGRGLVETMSLTSSNMGGALQNYKEGLIAAEQALFGRQELTEGLMSDIVAGNRQLGFAEGFNNFNALVENDETIRLLAAELKERQNAGLDQATLERLREANKWLYIANYHQLRTGLGIYRLYAYLSDVDNQRDVQRVLESEGVDRTFIALTGTPSNFKTLVDSFGSAFSLYGVLGEVTDFSTEKEALAELGIPGEIASFEAAADEQAKALKGRYSDVTTAEPDGGIIEDYLEEQPWAEDGYRLLGPSFANLMHNGVNVVCNALRGESVAGVERSGSKGLDVEPSAPPLSSPEADARTLTKAEKREVQSLLNEAGYNAGTPDGVVGPKTRNALFTFRQDQGLPGGDKVDGLALEQLEAHLQS